MLGFGAFIWTCKVLIAKNYSKNDKLRVLHIKTIIWCFVFLCITRFLILIAILSSYWKICLIGLLWYITFGSIISIDNLIKHVDKWEEENKLTLYDLKKKYDKSNKS